MIQTWRFPIVLSMSVVFGMPALHAMMTSPDQLFRSGLAYLGALGLSWLGVNFVFGLMDHYASHNRRQRSDEDAADVERELLEIRERELARERAAASTTPGSSARVDEPVSGAAA